MKEPKSKEANKERSPRFAPAILASDEIDGNSYYREQLLFTIWFSEARKERSSKPKPRWGFCVSGPLPQGSSFLATLGFGTQSLWDWQTIRI